MLWRTLRHETPGNGNASQGVTIDIFLSGLPLSAARSRDMKDSASHVIKWLDGSGRLAFFEDA